MDPGAEGSRGRSPPNSSRRRRIRPVEERRRLTPSNDEKNHAGLQDGDFAIGHALD